MGRTPTGDGYPRRQADGSWAQWLDCGYRDGKRVRKRVTGATKEAVKIKIAEMRMRLDRGEDITTPPPAAALPVTPARSPCCLMPMWRAQRGASAPRPPTPI